MTRLERLLCVLLGFTLAVCFLLATGTGFWENL